MSSYRNSCASVLFPLGNERFLHQQQSSGEAFDCDVTNPMFRAGCSLFAHGLGQASLKLGRVELCATFHDFDAASKYFPSVSPDDRYQMAFIALGQKCPDKSFLPTTHPPSPDLVGNSLESHTRPLSLHPSIMQQTAKTEDEGHFTSFIEV
ncbi:hypothetical protein AVEN_126256-1 [Araneus ventricosus]|uniref:Uncharacterized protein n=1 Tax=Araneus ventricosus TaxID=182803 RepID=A0A4Y2L3G2_ARAVE|nr:hypothetical protein AVEN_126256-1 [Araneus ventricosus]